MPCGVASVIDKIQWNTEVRCRDRRRRGPRFDWKCIIYSVQRSSQPTRMSSIHSFDLLYKFISLPNEKTKSTSNISNSLDSSAPIVFNDVQSPRNNKRSTKSKSLTSRWLSPEDACAVRSGTRPKVRCHFETYNIRHEWRVSY
jgi:hypothetical protein